jgi:hypothetical protein
MSLKARMHIMSELTITSESRWNNLLGARMDDFQFSKSMVHFNKHFDIIRLKGSPKTLFLSIVVVQ